ncbi:Cloroperoxidase [Russula aff. rugulosa BPL654]|nr:Cloroperoxidase [Russula aff. rugulosa BPL654]
MAFIIIALRRIGRGIFSKLFSAIFMLGWMGWDFSLVLVNLITFKRKVGRVTPKGLPGEGGVWPEYIPPRKGDSRCSCPGLNTMANHGIIPRDGRNISFREVTGQVRTTYNFSPSFSVYTVRYIANILNRSYNTGRFDLSDIDVHNGIEHDASLVRRDAYEEFHQGMPDGALRRHSSGSSNSTPPHQRRREALQSNRQYSQDFKHKVFGSSNASTLVTIFGGRLSDIYTFLTEERIPNGWESRVRDQMGLTFFSLNRTVIGVELGIKEEVNQPLNLL